MVQRATPVRTCVGCRNRAPASTLLRVVAVIDAGVTTLVPDPRHRLPGRGAYLHDDPACLATAERRRAFGRALRVAGVLDTGPLAAYLTAHGRAAAPEPGRQGMIGEHDDVPAEQAGTRRVRPRSKVGTTDMSTR